MSSCLQSGQLNEYTERKEMSADVVCMSLANVPPGEQRSRFLAVGLADNTVRIISLDPSVSSSGPAEKRPRPGGGSRPPGLPMPFSSGPNAFFVEHGPSALWSWALAVANGALSGSWAGPKRCSSRSFALAASEACAFLNARYR